MERDLLIIVFSIFAGVSGKIIFDWLKNRPYNSFEEKIIFFLEPKFNAIKEILSIEMKNVNIRIETIEKRLEKLENRLEKLENLLMDNNPGEAQ